MDLKLLFIVILSAFPALFDRALCEEKQIGRSVIIVVVCLYRPCDWGRVAGHGVRFTPGSGG